MSRYDECMQKFKALSGETKSRIEQGIENNRKGRLKIVLKDRNGNPIENAKVKVIQKSHEFLYGANLYMLDEFECEEKNTEYRKCFAEVFNQATLPFYWSDLEPEEGKPRFAKDSPKIYRRPTPDLCLEYCEEKRITPKEHCLTYLAWQPEWVDKDDTSGTKIKLEKRYKELAERYSDKIHCWEVINELMCAYQKPNYTSAFFKEDDVLEWNFKLAERYFPDNQLVVNEAPFVWHREHYAYNRSPYYMIIERALRNGARIDAIGMQFHVFEKAWEKYMCDPELILEILDRYSDFGLPIQITEVTVPAYGDSREDEKLQADLIENLYTLWFSHKSVEMITYWNTVDGYAVGAPKGDMTKGENLYYGGLINFDMSKKMAFDRIKYLFNEKWHTEESTASNCEGEIEIHGFYGEYEIEINNEKFKAFHSSKSDKAIELIVEG